MKRKTMPRPSTPLVVPRLRQASYDVTYQEFDGPHTVPPEIAQAAVAWFLADRAVAPEPSSPPADDAAPQARSLVVRPGDSLAGIARQLYGDAAAWPQIYAANRAAIGPDPNHLEVGLELTLPGS